MVKVEADGVGSQQPRQCFQRGQRVQRVQRVLYLHARVVEMETGRASRRRWRIEQ